MLRKCVLVALSGSQTVTGAPTFAASGAPFAVTSSQVVSNLNADLLNGQHATAFARKLHNVLTVGPGSEEFSTIQAAIDSITDASATNRYLIEVAPGTYSESVVMQSFVDIRGAGERLTYVSCPSVPGIMTQAIQMADDTLLEGVNASCNGTGIPRAVYLPGGSATVRDSQLSAGGTNVAVAVRLETTGTFTLEHVSASSSGQDGTILSNNSGAVVARDSEILGAVTAIEIGGSASLANTELNGAVNAGSATCVGVYHTDFSAFDSTCN